MPNPNPQPLNIFEPMSTGPPKSGIKRNGDSEQTPTIQCYRISPVQDLCD